MNRTYCAALFAGVCGAAFLGASAASAADATPAASADQPADAQVIVTAEKRPENLQNVPMAVQAIQPAQIEQAGATNVTDLVKLIPGASLVSSLGAGFETVQIRGIASGAFGDGLVGYYVDDTAFDIPNIQLAPPAGLLDAERVEVIRGPSGTLYGQGSMGGTIKIVTKQPDSQSFSGRAFAETSFTQGGAGDYDVGGVLNLPIVKDKLAVRVSGEYDYLSGYANEQEFTSPFAATPTLLRQHANDVNSANIRVAGLWTPSDDVSVSAFYWYIRDSQNFSNVLSSTNPPVITGAGGVHGMVDVDMNVYSGTLKWKSPIGDVVINSSYFDHHLGLLLPFNTPLFGFNFPSLVDDTFRTHQFTQEVRVTSKENSPIKWLAGVFYRDATINTDALENISLTSIGFGNDAIINFAGPLTTQSWSVYGEASAPLFDGKLEPLVGLRYYEDRRSFNATEFGATNFPRTAPGTPDSNAQTFSSLNPRFNLKYKPTDNGLFYLNIAKGFRSGGSQSQSQATAAEGDLGLPAHTIKTEVDPDSLWTYEVGTRWELAGRSLVVEAGVYHTDWSNVIVVFQLLPSGVLALDNVGSARINGADFGLVWRPPASGLTFTATGNVDDARMVTVLPGLAAKTNFKPGARMPNVPASNFTVSANYSRPLDWLDGVTGSLYAAYSFRDRQLDSAAATPSGQLNDVTLRAGVKKANWTVDAFVYNALNDKGPTAAGLIPYPLRAGVRVGVNF